ncbi:MAG: hypothetical protein HY556_11835 [Euryarchaeota archaeon]|jgi:hypothetical protein|nr:hypothetical protein [Euryarchaeota archaeon]
MANMTLAVPEDLFTLIKKHPEIKWSVIAREAMWDYARRVDLMEKLASKSKLTEKDIEEVGRKIKKSLAKRYEAEA